MSKGWNENENDNTYPMCNLTDKFLYHFDRFYKKRLMLRIVYKNKKS